MTQGTLSPQALQWYALQVRYEEVAEAPPNETESEVLSKCGLAKACQPAAEQRRRPIALEVESMSELSAL